jgi:hypothetical protein
MFSSASFGRRRLIRGLLAMLVWVGFVPSSRARNRAAPPSVVRISRGSFAPERYDDVRSRLAAAEASLAPAIRKLSGCLHYFAALDRESNSIVNVSVWRSLADAQQMQTLAPMLKLAEEFVREGVRFERPVLNFDTLWELHF